MERKSNAGPSPSKIFWRHTSAKKTQNWINELLSFHEQGFSFYSGEHQYKYVSFNISC